jgi:type IX secretion system PorP/SprF family membrane protein
MIRNNTLKATSIAALLAMAGTKAMAQDIHFTQFEASPLIVNPSFTGGFNGTARVAAIYRNQWQSITTPFSTFAASADAPIVRDLTVDDYLAAGIQFYNDRAGDANLSNTSVLASLAYHKFLGGSSSTEPNKVLSVGLQGGYTSKSIDISKLYFGDEFVNGVFNPGSGQEYPYLNNKVDYWNVNAGISFSHSTSDRFGYTLGVGANNLTQPRETFSTRPERNSELGLSMRYNAQAGAIWYTGERLSIRPGVLYQTQATTYELIAGSEFNYTLGNPEFRSIATSVFIGGWYRNNDAAMITAGVEFKGFRLGASYDYNTSALRDATKGNGGFEISLRYIAPNPLDFARRLIYPCARF